MDGVDAIRLAMVPSWAAVKGAWKGAIWWRLGLLLPGLLLLTGCFQYDLTLRFDHQTHGQIVQTIALSERGAALSSTTLNPWLANLRERVRPLGGQLTETDRQRIELTVPFTTAADLVERFDQVFADAPDAVDEPVQTLTLPGLGPVPFHLAIDQRNWGLASYTHLIYDLDLTTLPDSLSDTSSGETASDLTRTGLRFRLQTPFGTAQVPESSAPPQQITPSGATWLLQPGSRHHLEATFWVPNAVGISAVVIAVLVLAGYFVRYRVLKRPKLS